MTNISKEYDINLCANKALNLVTDECYNDNCNLRKFYALSKGKTETVFVIHV